MFLKPNFEKTDRQACVFLNFWSKSLKGHQHVGSTSPCLVVWNPVLWPEFSHLPARTARGSNPNPHVRITKACSSPMESEFVPTRRGSKQPPLGVVHSKKQPGPSRPCPGPRPAPTWCAAGSCRSPSSSASARPASPRSSPSDPGGNEFM